MTLGEIFADARQRKGLTLRELEARCGVSNPLIHQIEKGKVRDPGFRTVVRIARVLRLSLQRLANADPPSV